MSETKLENHHNLLAAIERKIKENEEKIINIFSEYVDMILKDEAIHEDKFYDLMRHYAICSLRECGIKADVMYVADDMYQTTYKTYLSLDELKIDWYKMYPEDKAYIRVNNAIIAFIVIRYDADILWIQLNRYIKINKIENIRIDYPDEEEDKDEL
ncbi:MAG: hypothetical protein QXQ96_10625 [Sulfolobales archaeon]